MLKNCPFCGEQKARTEIKTSKGATGEWQISVYCKCQSCRARGSSFKTNDMQKQREITKKAIEAWNGRS